jgi:hypothetical protein
MRVNLCDLLNALNGELRKAGNFHTHYATDSEINALMAVLANTLKDVEKATSVIEERS